MLDRRGRRLQRRVAGQDDDGDVVVLLADEAKQVDARELGHHQVDDADVVLAGFERVDDLSRVVDGRDVVAVVREEILEVLADVFVVIDDQ